MNVALIGCGSIATILARAIDAGEVGGVALKAVYDVKPDAAYKLVKQLKSNPRVVGTVAELYENRDIKLIIEAASQEAVREYAVNIMKAGKDMMVMSVGAFSDEKLFDAVKSSAETMGTRLYIPSGAILGIDGIKSVMKAGIDEVLLTTRKPPKALRGVEYISEQNLDLSELRVPLIVFEGTAEEAVEAFPFSVNVAATLSLVGLGLKKTKVRVVADPSVTRNVHVIRVRGKAGEFVTEAHNVPSPDNPRTSYLAALSAIRALKNLTENIVIGT